MIKLFRYTGLIAVSESYAKQVKSIIIADLHDASKAPTRLEVLGDMREYIYELEGTDAEERYINADYCYDSNLFLRRIEIPGKKTGIPAKVIAINFSSYTMAIFGQREFLETDEPESMSPEEYQNYLDYLIKEES